MFCTSLPGGRVGRRRVALAHVLGLGDEAVVVQLEVAHLGGEVPRRAPVRLLGSATTARTSGSSPVRQRGRQGPRAVEQLLAAERAALVVERPLLDALGRQLPCQVDALEVGVAVLERAAEAQQLALHLAERADVAVDEVLREPHVGAQRPRRVDGEDAQRATVPARARTAGTTRARRMRRRPSSTTQSSPARHSTSMLFSCQIHRGS